MLRPGCLVFTTAYGDARVRIDLARFPALESIARDDNPGRRVALANLFLEPWLAPLRTGDNDIGIGPLVGLAIANLTPDVERASPFARAASAGNAPDAPLGRPAEYGLALMIAVSAFAPLSCVVEDIAPALVAALGASREAMPETANAGHLAALPLPGRLRIASRGYRPAVLASLREGDVLLGWPLRQPYRPGAPLAECELRWGAPGGMQYRIPVDVGGSRITLKGPFTMTNDTLDYAARTFADDADPDPTAPDTAAAPATRHALDALEVLVHVEIGALTLPLAALAAMGPGHLLELPTPIADAPVRLVSCGRTLGTGELVAVGDNLGVRITHLAADDGR